ncbi:hypothetical protein AQUCO_03700203v1 [Aquilegia coerulea]|uniref:DCD domain-containing protein n=1 Tax=Aquilegia coerulea TaxID=218851 RepID=A0A2G5CU29_AQUCA|nr:hypothetical protein AQUCO_03700203v1 [Aquilegia coerulea]
MENNQQSFWQFSDQLRLQSSNFANLSINDAIWGNSFTSKRPEERKNFDIRVGGERVSAGNSSFSSSNNDFQLKGSNFNGFNDGWKSFGVVGSNNNTTTTTQKNFNGNNGVFHKGVYNNNSSSKHGNNKSNSNNSNKKNNKKDEDYETRLEKKINNNNNNNSNKNSVDKRFKTLPASEALPRNEVVGGYIFVCNNDTMEENLKRQLFGLPPRYRDSVRAITPGLPLFLYNYSTHQLHGIFEAASFGGTNIDPTAWEDKKCPGESRFPAQVRVATRKICNPLEEDSFRPILHHYDGPKFRLELNIPEV